MADPRPGSQQATGLGCKALVQIYEIFVLMEVPKYI
jgi:hypothetical protein